MMLPEPFDLRVAVAGLLWWGAICLGLGSVGAVLLSLLT